jgi:nucleoside-diphosphate-sugar epimerase
MTRTLVTGAGGYIGRHVVHALANRGVEVIALQRTDAASDPRAQTLVNDFSALRSADLQALGPIDTVIHLAWSDGFNHNAASHVDALPHHVQFVREVGLAGIRHFVGMGTMHEIGYWEGMIGETTPALPRSMYGIAKNALREATRLITEQDGSLFHWLRSYYITGDDTRNKSLFAKILQWEAEGRSSFPFNSGKSCYDFIDVRALAEQIAAVAVQRSVTGIIECCSGTPVALKDKVEQFIAEHRLAIRPEYGAFPERAYDSPAVWGDASRIRAIIQAERSDASTGRDD